jgi:AcrR family transcriptional regulator
MPAAKVDVMPARSRIDQPGRYRAAVATHTRDSILDALCELLLERNWRAVTMTDVAAAAGMSKQTLYNEFGSRRGLAQGYAIRLTDAFASVIEAALLEHENNALDALEQGFAAFFDLSKSDPLVLSLHSGEPPDDLLRLITTDSDPIIDRAGQRLAQTFQQCWVGASEHQADIISKVVVRLALSYIPTPPADSAQTANDVAQLVTPFIEAIGNSS